MRVLLLAQTEIKTNFNISLAKYKDKNMNMKQALQVNVIILHYN